MRIKGRGSVFRKFLTSYLLISILPIAILGSIFYYYNVVNYKENVRESNLNRLIQIKNQIDLDLKALSDVTYHISNNKQILEPDIINSKSNRDIGIAFQLKTYMTTCSFLDDILFYYRGDKKVYLTDGCYSYHEFENNIKKGFEWWKSNFFVSINTIIAPKIKRINTSIQNENMSDRLLAFMYPIPYLDTLPSGTVVYMIREDYILSKFDEFFEDFRGCIFIFDNYYNMLVSFNKGISDSDKNILKCQCSEYKGVGTWNISINRSDYVAMKTVSENNGWSYVIVMPEMKYFQGVNEMRFKVLNIISFLIIMGFILALILSKNNYKPIKALSAYMKNQDSAQYDCELRNELEAIRFSFEKSHRKSRELVIQVNAQRPFVRDQCLIKILNGKVDNVSELDYLLKCSNIQLQGVAYFSMVLSTRIRGMENVSIEELLKLLENVMFIGAEGYGVELIQEKVIAIVVSIENDTDCYMTQQKAIAEDVSSLIEKSFSIKPVIGVGDVYADIFQLKTSFLEALSTLYENYANFSTNIFFFSDMKNQQPIEWYPVIQQSLYIESLKYGNKTVALDTLNSMLDAIVKVTKSYFVIKCQCFDILNTVIKSINKIDISEDFVYNIKQLTMFETLEEFREGMEKFTIQFCDFMDKLKEKRNSELKNSIIKYVNENYTSLDISLNDIASKFDVSSTYVSRFFKEETGMNFIDYITNLRMDYVKKQLRDTDKKVKDIAAEVGYVDASSFSRKFKAMEGVTPVQYRKIIKQLR